MFLDTTIIVNMMLQIKTMSCINSFLNVLFHTFWTKSQAALNVLQKNNILKYGPSANDLSKHILFPKTIITIIG